MLRACNRILRPGGGISLLVIDVAEGLGADRAEAARAVGPEFIDAGPGYEALLAEAGFTGTEVVDVTDEYRATLSAWLREWEREAAELTPLVGADTFEDRQGRRRRALAALGEGLLRRTFITATKPA